MFFLTLAILLQPDAGPVLTADQVRGYIEGVARGGEPADVQKLREQIAGLKRASEAKPAGKSKLQIAKHKKLVKEIQADIEKLEDELAEAIAKGAFAKPLLAHPIKPGSAGYHRDTRLLSVEHVVDDRNAVILRPGSPARTQTIGGVRVQTQAASSDHVFVLRSKEPHKYVDGEQVNLKGFYACRETMRVGSETMGVLEEADETVYRNWILDNEKEARQMLQEARDRQSR